MHEGEAEAKVPILSLVPKLLVGREKRGWYPLFTHALNFPQNTGTTVLYLSTVTL